MSIGSRPVDLELKKAFAELQQKVVETNQRIKFADGQIDAIKRNILHKKLTDSEIEKLPTGTKVYQGVGRCFLLSSIPEIRKLIGKNVGDYNEKIKAYEVNKEHLEKDIKNGENSLRELVIQKKNAL